MSEISNGRGEWARQPGRRRYGLVNAIQSHISEFSAYNQIFLHRTSYRHREMNSFRSVFWDISEPVAQNGEQGQMVSLFFSFWRVRQRNNFWKAPNDQLYQVLNGWLPFNVEMFSRAGPRRNGLIVIATQQLLLFLLACLLAHCACVPCTIDSRISMQHFKPQSFKKWETAFCSQR